jgi:hypothetical protein
LLLIDLSISFEFFSHLTCLLFFYSIILNTVMSRPDSPISGEALQDVFNQILQSPALRQQLHQLLPLTPATPAVASDPAINHQIISIVTSIPIAAIRLAYPLIADTHAWYSGIKPLIGTVAHFSPDKFTAWVHPPKILSDDELASACIQKFIADYPFSQFAQNLLPSDNRYALVMSQMSNSQTSLPPVLDTILSALGLCTYFYQHLARYYVNHGTVCLAIILEDHLESLQQRISKVKYPTYDIDNPSSLYHLGWILYTNRQELIKNPSILTTHFKLLKQSKDGTELSTRQAYLSSVNLFFKNFGFAFDLSSAEVYTRYKDLFHSGFSNTVVRDYVKTTLFPQHTTIKALVRAVVAHEELIQIKVASAPISPPPVKQPQPAGAAAAAAIAAALIPQPSREGRKAHVATKPVAFCTNPPCSKTTDHRTHTCPQPCKLDGCSAPAAPHLARFCYMIHDTTAFQKHHHLCTLFLVDALCPLLLGTLMYPGVFRPLSLTLVLMCLYLLFPFQMLHYAHVLISFMLLPVLRLLLLALPL